MISCDLGEKQKLVLADVNLSHIDDAYMFAKFEEQSPVINFRSIEFYAKHRPGAYGLSNQVKDHFHKQKEGFFKPEGLTVSGESRSKQFMVTWSKDSFLAGYIGKACAFRKVD